MKLNLQSLRGVNRHLIREMFIAHWRRMNWPLQNMGFAQWDCLAELAVDSDDVQRDTLPRPISKRTFPGNIEVVRQGGTLTLSQSGVRS